MNLSKTKLAFYGLLLAAALTGLLISHTRSSEAAPPQPDVPDEPTAPAQRLAGEELSVDAPRFASLFRPGYATDQRTAAQLVLSLIGPVRDVFALSPAMDQHYRVQSDSVQSENVRQAQQSAGQFQTAHRLNGTFIQAHDQWAIIDGAIVRVGQTLDDFQLRKIEHYRVVFQRGVHTVVLELSNDFDTQVRPSQTR